MNAAPLDRIEVETGAQPVLSVVWLHGLGADGRDFQPIVPQLGLSFPARFVFPHAPVRPITINGGMSMRAWFDILTLERGGPEDIAAVTASAAAVAALIDAELERGFDAQRIVLAGFSQGGALALHLGLRYPQRLGGIMALSAFLVAAGRLESEAVPGREELPIFMAHGTYDNVIELPFAELGRDRLTAAGYAPQWRTYAMGHAVCPEEVRDIAVWLENRAAAARQQTIQRHGPINGTEATRREVSVEEPFSGRRHQRAHGAGIAGHCQEIEQMPGAALLAGAQTELVAAADIDQQIPAPFECQRGSRHDTAVGLVTVTEALAESNVLSERRLTVALQRKQSAAMHQMCEHA